VSPPAITLDHLTLRHGSQPAVCGLSGSFPPGSLTAVVGPNGAGKTTLLRALAGVHPPAEGRIDRGRLAVADMALLPQSNAFDRAFPLSCRDVVAFGLYSRSGPFRALQPAQHAAIDAALAAVGLPGHGSRPIGNLSAGQLQRVLFARLIAQDAAVLLLDEPFGAVDVTTAMDLLGLIQDWHAQGRTVVAVLHDLDLVRDAFPSTLLLATEQVAWGPTAAVLTEANRRRAGLLLRGWAGQRLAAA